MHKLKPQYITLSPNERLYNSELPIIGLTGGIASGKSTVSTLLQAQSLPIIDADKLVKDIYKVDATVDFVKNLHPSSVDHKNEINFRMLREVFFKDILLKEKLETFLHQQIPSFFQKELQGHIKNGTHFIIYDAPLIFEKGIHSKIDSTVLVYCSIEEQIKRIIKRDNSTKDLALKIIDKQMSLDHKLKLAQYVINNQKAKLNLEREVEDFLKEYLK